MAVDASLAARTTALVEQGELKQALKLLERERRQALSREDIASVEHVSAASKVVYAHADGKQQSEAGRISFAAQQNIRQLGRKAALDAGEQWVDPFSTWREAERKPAVIDRARTIFGDARSVRSLAIASVAGIASFPVWWFLGMIAWGWGGDNGDSVATPPPADGGRHSVRVVIVVAAALAGASLVVTTLSWARARRRAPVSERTRLTENERLIYPAAVLLVLGAAIGLFGLLWIFTPLRSEFAPYTSP